MQSKKAEKRRTLDLRQARKVKREADGRDYAIMLNYEQGRGQHEPQGIRNQKRADYCANMDQLLNARRG
jgi:hypothetical protein